LLTLFYSGLNAPGILIPAQAKVVHWNGSSWDNLGGINGTGSIDNTLGSTGGAAPGDPITTFSPFAIGGAVGVIPITLEYFYGLNNDQTNTIAWKANCSGTGNVTFSIERSRDGIAFNSISEISASILRCRQPFDITDPEPLPGINYYRLKITDADGIVSYSSIIKIINKQKRIALVSFSPNPLSANGNATLQISSSKNGILQILIHDMNGKLIKHVQDRVVSAGNNHIAVYLPQLAPGAYQVSVIDDEGNKAALRFIKE
jgi:hypothetical protein